MTNATLFDQHREVSPQPLALRASRRRKEGRNSMRRIILAVSLFLPALAFAQAETTGRISGVVKDQQGRPVPNAEITLSSPTLQGERTLQTDATGRYLATQLPPGQYIVNIEATGMNSALFNLRVGVGQTVPLDVSLTPGERVTEEVTVYAPAARLETTATGENFNYEEQIDELPIVNRNIERVAELAPNVSFGPTPDTLSISGAPSFDTTVLLDGAEISDPYFGSAPDVYIEEAVEEVQVLTGGISARYGRFQGGVINATTKSGGNTFDGSVRTDLSKESWNSQTPFGEDQSSELNRVYSGTISGPIVKDRLTFFGAGRTIPTFEDSATTVNPTGLAATSQNYVVTTDQDRWQIKLNGSVTPNHVIEGSYLKFDQSTSNYDGLPPAHAQALGQRDDPRETQTLEYNGILNDRLSLSFQATRKRVSILSGATDATRSPFVDFYGADIQVWNNHWWDFGDPSDRDNDTAALSLTQALSTSDWGDHTLEYGIQYVNSVTAGENRQSATGFNLLNVDALVSGNEFADVNNRFAGGDPSDPRFNLISLFDPNVTGVTYRWVALPLGGDQELQNLAAYVQDSWEIGRFRIDAGLRWESYEGSGPRPTLDLDFDEVSPRLGVTYNLDENWQLQTSWGKYVSRFNDNVASSVSGVGGAPYVVQLYTGPTLCSIGTWCATADQLEAVLRDPTNWGVTVDVSDPTQPTRFMEPGTAAPYAIDFNVGVRRGLGARGSLALTYTDRRYEDLLDDFRGGLGFNTVTDPLGSGEQFLIDTTFWANAEEAKRYYRAITAAFDYRPSARWGVGGNYTYANTEANYEGEGLNQPSSGSIIGDYPASIPQDLAVPYGPADDDIRHRVRAWGTYNFDFERWGNLSLGSVALFQSGLPYSLAGDATIEVDNPAYANEVGTTYTLFPEGRGKHRFNDFWRLDLSTKYSYPFNRDFTGYLKLNVLNVTDNDELVSFNTAGTVEQDAGGNLFFLPGQNFGQPRNDLDYQLPRTFQISAGLEW